MRKIIFTLAAAVLALPAQAEIHVFTGNETLIRQDMQSIVSGMLRLGKRMDGLTGGDVRTFFHQEKSVPIPDFWGSRHLESGAASLALEQSSVLHPTGKSAAVQTPTGIVRGILMEETFSYKLRTTLQQANEQLKGEIVFTASGEGWSPRFKLTSSNFRPSVNIKSYAAHFYFTLRQIALRFASHHRLGR